MATRKTPWATLILTTVTLVALTFGLWERGIATSVLLVAWAVWYVLRHRKAYEEELGSSEAKYREIVDNSREAISLVNGDGAIVEWNRRAEELYGYTRGEALGRPPLTVPEDRREEWRSLWGMALRGNPARDVDTYRVDKRGRRVEVILSMTSFHDGTGTRGPVLVVERDVTEEKKKEGQARQTERLAAIGRMAAKVAHEIRNPLGALSLNVELLRGEAHGGAAEKICRSLMTEVDRLNNVVEDYLSFSRLPRPTEERISINDLLTDIADFLTQRTSRNGIRVIRNLRQDLPKAQGDRHQLRSVFLNLLKNAQEAMPQGGELRIDTHLRPDDPGFLQVVISDSGEGIPAEDLPRIFEPFFTTKPSGTGLGLAISRQIVQEHGGTLECESRVNQGTTFTVSLPLYWRKA